MTRRVDRGPRAARLAGAAVAALLAAGGLAGLAGCSTPRSSQAPATPSATPTSTSPYVEAPSDEATPTTQPGSALALGAQATVWWKPTATAKALLQLRVTAIHRTTFKQSFRGWKITADTAKTTPYFVTARVSSSSKSVSGRPVPLYALDTKDQLVQASSFRQAFKPCGPGTFPVHTRPGRGSDVCLVFLVPPGTQLRGVTYRPDQSLAPITWKGALTPLTPGASPSPTGKTTTKP